MIIFVSDGRLGNQLFQLAFLQTLVKKEEKVVCFNMSSLLRTFDFKSSKFSFYQFSRIGFALYRRIIKPILINIFTKLRIIGNCYQIRKGDQSFPEVLITKGLFPITVVETNFFQSEELFDTSKVSFSIKEELVIRAKEIFSSLPKEYEKVFVHVRRGDYLGVSYNGEVGIELPMSYYQTAIKKMEEKVVNPYYIFLTDDYSFVKSNFSYLKNSYYSRENMGVDLALMHLCENGIISNSSFSWWGAFLMRTKKNVFAPKYWYGWKTKKESHISIQPKYSNLIEVQ